MQAFCELKKPNKEKAKNHIYHLDKKDLDRLENRPPKKFRTSFFHEMTNIGGILKKGRVSFETDIRRIWGKNGDFLFPDRSVYWLNIDSLNEKDVRVTNDYYHTWLDEEIAIWEIFSKFQELDIETLEELLEIEPDFIFSVSWREGVLTGRSIRNREKNAEFSRKNRKQGYTLQDFDYTEELMDTVEHEGPIQKEDFKLKMCKYRTRDQIKKLWEDTVNNWIEKNTKPFNISDLEEYRGWKDKILVPGPIPVVN